MGGQQSTRRITVINDEASGVIKISDSVVQRLKEEINNNAGQQQQQQQQQSGSTPPPSAPPPPQPTKSEPPPTSQPPPEPPPVVTPEVPQKQQQQEVFQPQQQQQQRPIIQYVEREPSMSSLKVRAEKEKELAEAEAYWKDRLHKMEHEHSVTSNLHAAAFDELTAKLDGRFLKVRQAPICEDKRKSVIDCYKQNKESSLLCAQQVRDFAKCVDCVRVGFLNRSG